MNREINWTEWVRLVESDREAARILFEAGHHEACTFHCQQAIEKLLKAILVKQTNFRPPHIHSLRLLLERVGAIEVPPEIIESASLIDAYYVGSRYPLDAIDPDKFDRPLAESALHSTDRVFTWFSTHINFDNT